MTCHSALWWLQPPNQTAKNLEFAKNASGVFYGLKPFFVTVVLRFAWTNLLKQVAIKHFNVKRNGCHTRRSIFIDQGKVMWRMRKQMNWDFWIQRLIQKPNRLQNFSSCFSIRPRRAGRD